MIKIAIRSSYVPLGKRAICRFSLGHEAYLRAQDNLGITNIRMEVSKPEKLYAHFVSIFYSN